MNPHVTKAMTHNRRGFLQGASLGMAGLAFSDLAHANSGTPQRHFPGKAKRVIFLDMLGGPAPFETFLYKKGSTTMKGQRHGQTGTWVCEHFPQIAKIVDKLCFLNGMHCDHSEHNMAQIQMHCGVALGSRPSMGSWISYGLGSENSDLPGYINLGGSFSAFGDAKVYDSAFLPKSHAGMPLKYDLQVADVARPGLSPSKQRHLLDQIQRSNQHLLAKDPTSGQIKSLIESYEMAFRMKGFLPELLDVDQEPETMQSFYGADRAPTKKFARACLAARRLSEAGVRFVEIKHANWDHHNDIAKGIPRQCSQVDQPIAALILDLEQRGLLDDTLILWGGEFGRTPDEASNHNAKGYTMWMCGGGVKEGYCHGDTDERGIEAVEGRVHIHDLHATILHLLGLDHEKLTYRYGARDWRLTDVAGKVVHEIIS